MVVISNTSPLRDLIGVGRGDLVEQIFDHVVIPYAVERELTDLSTPVTVRQWMARRPARLEVRHSLQPDSELAARLDEGEAEAIQ